MSLKTERIKQPVIGATTQPLLIGGIGDSDSKLTIATDGSISTSTAVTVPSLVVNSKNVESSLLASYTVTGSAVTSIDFSGLDINTHKSYIIEIELKNASTSTLNLYAFVNGDATISNYYNQLGMMTGSSFVGGRGTAPTIGHVNNSQSGVIMVNIFKVDGYYQAISMYVSGSGASSVENSLRAIWKPATVTNITQLTLTADVSNSIAVGSKIRLYRGDV